MLESFGSANHLWGTCLANQSRALTPTGIGLHDVLQSTAISSRASVSSVTAVVEQVQRLAASGARRERPDEDIRRMALDKLHDIILSDLSSTQLGVSLADIVQSGGDSDGFLKGVTVLFFDLLLPPLRFLPYGFLATGSPRLTAFLSSSVTGKAPC